jgi:MOSC domain-containing protein YiiM
MSGSVKHIFIASARGASMQSLRKVKAVADSGLVGDRYSNAEIRRSLDYQLTLIEMENIESFCRETGLELLPSDPRRNLVTSGVRLNELNGQQFSIGSVQLQALDLCEPCSTFVEYTHEKVLRYFVGRGGLRCRIIKGGIIRVGDEIKNTNAAKKHTLSKTV